MYFFCKTHKYFPDTVTGFDTVDGKVYEWVKPRNKASPSVKARRMQVEDYS